MINYLGMLFRAKKVIVISFLLIFGLVLAAIVVRPSKYRARMTFLLRNERAEPLVGADPHQNSIQLPDVTEENLNSEVELLNSFEVLRQVVLDCNLASKNTPASIDTATSTLGKSLTVTPVRNSSIINVAYDSKDKQKAHQVLQDVARVYLSKRADLHTATQATSFFNQENGKAQQGLRTLEQERAEFLSHNGYENLPQQIQLTLEYAQSLHGQLDGAETQLQEAEGRLKQIASDRGTTPERVPTQQRIASNAYATQTLTNSLVLLQNRKAELQTKFSPGDRMIQQVDQEIKNTQDALNGFVDMKPQESVSDANPAWQALDAEANRLHETKTGLVGRIAQLRSQLAVEQDKLRKMVTDGTRVDDLNRRVKAAADRLDLYENKSVAAKIADDLDAQHISNVVLASGPTSPAVAEPSPLNFVSGLLFSILASLSIGFISQLLSSKLYGASTIESETGVPVIATLPTAARS